MIIKVSNQELTTAINSIHSLAGNLSKQKDFPLEILFNVSKIDNKYVLIVQGFYGGAIIRVDIQIVDYVETIEPSKIGFNRGYILINDSSIEMVVNSNKEEKLAKLELCEKCILLHYIYRTKAYKFIALDSKYPEGIDDISLHNPIAQIHSSKLTKFIDNAIAFCKPCINDDFKTIVVTSKSLIYTNSDIVYHLQHCNSTTNHEDNNGIHLKYAKAIKKLVYNLNGIVQIGLTQNEDMLKIKIKNHILMVPNEMISEDTFYSVLDVLEYEQDSKFNFYCTPLLATIQAFNVSNSKRNSVENRLLITITEKYLNLHDINSTKIPSTKKVEKLEVKQSIQISNVGFKKNQNLELCIYSFISVLKAFKDTYLSLNYDSECEYLCANTGGSNEHVYFGVKNLKQKA